MKNLLPFLVLGIITARAADLPGAAALTLPLKEARALLAGADAPLIRPAPVASVLSEVDLAVDLRPLGVLTAQFQINVLANGWHVVPLLGGDLDVRRVEPADSPVVVRDGMFCLVVRDPGLRSLRLELTAKGETLRLRVPPLVRGDLAVTAVPAGARATVCVDGRPVSLPCPLPAEGAELRIEVAAEDNLPMATRWASATLNGLVTEREDRLCVETRVDLRAAQGRGVTATLIAPPGASAITVSGPDLLPVTARGGMIDLVWETPGVTERSFVARYELPRSASGDWSLEPLKIDATPSTVRTILVPAADASLEGPGLQRGDPEQLPTWMAAALAGGGQAFVVEGAEPRRIRSIPRPRVALDEAAIPEAAFRSRIVPDGGRLTEAELRLEHRGPLRWRFRLPAGAELLACEVAGRRQAPIRLDDGELELLLRSDSTAASTTTRVKFRYIERGPAFAPVEGRLALALPATPVFIEQLAWTLALPTGYELTAFGGNVESAPDAEALTFQKRLVRREAPAVEVYYRKRDASL